MAIVLSEVFQGGGKRLVEILQFCVLSARMDPVFAYLVREYRAQPTMVRALTLFDLFCTMQSPARLNVPGITRRLNLRLAQEIVPLQQRAEELRRHVPVSAEDEEEQVLMPLLPPRYLFDEILAELQATADNAIDRTQREYDFSLTPHQNLPGGRMTPAQQQFADFVWKPQLRPRLVAAGFPILASIG